MSDSAARFMLLSVKHDNLETVLRCVVCHLRTFEVIIKDMASLRKEDG